MDNYNCRVISKKEIALDTYQFSFYKPKNFEFIAGQHIIVKLSTLDFHDGKGPIRPFTISSNPVHPELWISFRNTRSGFKQSLLKLSTNNRIDITGPRGNFIFDTLGNSSIFIAGGIGITPFFSFLQSLNNAQIDKKIMLFYSNKTLEQKAYHKFFNERKEKVKSFIYIPTCTNEPSKTWQGERRKIDIDFIRDYTKNLYNKRYYLCGPPGMVDTLTKQLIFQGISDKNIYSESFFGY